MSTSSSEPEDSPRDVPTAPPRNVKPIDGLDQEHQQLGIRERGQNISLRKTYAYSALIGMGIQTLIADYAFFKYGAGKRWQLPTAAIDGWLAATVTQVIGVVLVISRSLFPNGGNGD